MRRRLGHAGTALLGCERRIGERILLGSGVVTRLWRLRFGGLLGTTCD